MGIQLTVTRKPSEHSFIIRTLMRENETITVEVHEENVIPPSDKPDHTTDEAIRQSSLFELRDWFWEQ